MEDDDALPPLTLDEYDTAAVVAILIRTNRLERSITADEGLVAEATARIAENRLAKAKGISALAVFGFEDNKKIWIRVRRSIGNEAYERGLRIAKGVEPPHPSQTVNEDRRDVETLSADQGGTVPGASPPSTPTIGDAILNYLRSLDRAGANVGQIKKYLVSAYGIETHEKTPGMTLYRLLKQKKVRRVGRMWFYATPVPQPSSKADQT
jgi:hypothetical protein